MNNISSNNVTDDQILLVNVLNVMYNDNMRQIQNLNDANNDIRRILISTLNSRLNNTRIPNTNINTNTNTNRNNNSNRNTTTNTNTNSNSNRNNNRNNTNRNNNQPLPINTRPYIVENIPNRTSLLERYSNTIGISSQSLRENLNTTLGSFFDPVVINPTPLQIELSTRNVRYCDIVTPINRSCPITLENFNDNDMVTVIRFCGHIFNTEHLHIWFTTNCRCPVCRYDIRNYNSNSSQLISNIQTRQPDIRPGTYTNSSETNNEERNIGENASPLSELFYTFITTDVSGNTDATAILSLITSLQLNI
jgi:hypothetical protein